MERADGRTVEEVRPMKAKIGIIPSAEGSAMFSFGDTIAIAAVRGPRLLHPQHMQDSSKGILRVNYDLLPFSVADRKRPGPNRRAQEISKMIQWALEPVLDLRDFPNTVVDVQIYITQADAGTRTAGINAASMALAQAGIPMKDLVVSVAMGRLDKDVVADLTKEEEDFEGGEGPTDLPLAKVAKSDEYTLIQLDGKIPPEEISKAIKMADSAFKDIYNIQVDALKAGVQK
jgi:exosome complex component RRP41